MAFLQAPDSTNDHDLGLFEVDAGAGASLAGKATSMALDGSPMWMGVGGD